MFGFFDSELDKAKKEKGSATRQYLEAKDRAIELQDKVNIMRYKVYNEGDIDNSERLERLEKEYEEANAAEDVLREKMNKAEAEVDRLESLESKKSAESKNDESNQPKGESSKSAEQPAENTTPPVAKSEPYSTDIFNHIGTHHKNYFDITITPNGVGGNNLLDAIRPYDWKKFQKYAHLFIKQVQIADMTITDKGVRIIGPKFKLPIEQSIDSSTLNISWTMDNDGLLYGVFSKWIKHIYNAKTTLLSYLSDYSADITITIYKTGTNLIDHANIKGPIIKGSTPNKKSYDTNNIISVLKFYDCWPKTQSSMTVDNGSDAESTEFQNQFVFRRYEILSATDIESNTVKEAKTAAPQADSSTPSEQVDAKTEVKTEDDPDDNFDEGYDNFGEENNEYDEYDENILNNPGGVIDSCEADTDGDSSSKLSESKPAAEPPDNSMLDVWYGGEWG